MEVYVPETKAKVSATAQQAQMRKAVVMRGYPGVPQTKWNQVMYDSRPQHSESPLDFNQSVLSH